MVLAHGTPLQRREIPLEKTAHKSACVGQKHGGVT